MYKKFDLESRKQDPLVPSLAHLKWVQIALDENRPWTSTSWDSMRGSRNTNSRNKRDSVRDESSSLKDSMIVCSLRPPAKSTGPMVDSTIQYISENAMFGTLSGTSPGPIQEREPSRPQSHRAFLGHKGATDSINSVAASPRQLKFAADSQMRPSTSRALSSSRKNMSDMLEQIIEPLMRPKTASATAGHNRHGKDGASASDVDKTPQLQSNATTLPSQSDSIRTSIQEAESKFQSALLQASPPPFRHSERPFSAPSKPFSGFKRPPTARMISSQSISTALTSTVNGAIVTDESNKAKAPTTMAERQLKLKREKDVEGRLIRALLSDLNSLRQKLVLVQSQLDDSYQNMVISQSHQDSLQTQLDRTNFSRAIAEKELLRLQKTFDRYNSAHDDTKPDDFATENEGGYTTGASRMLIAALKLENFLDEAAASNDLQDVQVDQSKKLLNALMTFGVRSSGLTKCASISTQTE